MTTLWKWLALMRGFKPAYDYDMALLVVWHGKRRIHFTGQHAWKNAAKS